MSERKRVYVLDHLSDCKLEDRVQLLRFLREEKDAVLSSATDTSE